MRLSEWPKFKGLIILSIDEDVQHLEFYDIAGGNIKYKSGGRSKCVYGWVFIIIVLAVLSAIAPSWEKMFPNRRRDKLVVVQTVNENRNY